MRCLVKITIVSLMILTGCAHFQGVGIPYPDGDCPREFPVKGNDSSNGWIYHTYDSPYYTRVIAEMCFSEETDAKRWGYRRHRSRPRTGW